MINFGAPSKRQSRISQMSFSQRPTKPIPHWTCSVAASLPGLPTSTFWTSRTPKRQKRSAAPWKRNFRTFKESSFMFNTEKEYGVMDLVNRGSEQDSDSWERTVARLGNIDLLLSKAPLLERPLASGHVAQLIDFARRNYGIINADLSDALDEASLAVLREANRIFLVTTADLSALRMARLKARLFGDLGLGPKVSLL